MPEKTIAIYLALAPLLFVSGTACWSFILENKFKRFSQYSLYIANGGLVAALAVAIYLFFRLQNGLVCAYWQSMLYLDRTSALLTILICALALISLLHYPNKRKVTDNGISLLLFSTVGLIIAANSRELLSLVIGISTAFWPLAKILKAKLNDNSSKSTLWIIDKIRLKIGSVCCLLYGVALIMITEHTTTITKLSFSTEPLFLWSIFIITIGLGGELFICYSILRTACKKVSTFLYRTKFVCISLILILLLFVMNFFKAVTTIS